MLRQGYGSAILVLRDLKGAEACAVVGVEDECSSDAVGRDRGAHEPVADVAAGVVRVRQVGQTVGASGRACAVVVDLLLGQVAVVVERLDRDGVGLAAGAGVKDIDHLRHVVIARRILPPTVVLLQSVTDAWCVLQIINRNDQARTGGCRQIVVVLRGCGASIIYFRRVVVGQAGIGRIGAINVVRVREPARALIHGARIYFAQRDVAGIGEVAVSPEDRTAHGGSVLSHLRPAVVDECGGRGLSAAV